MILLFLFFCAECCASPQIFSINNWIQVPDGTLVAPFFNSKDCTSQLPWDLSEAFSVAAGEIEDTSSIVVMPLVSQMTFVLSGKLEIIMKDTESLVPNSLLLEANQAVFIKPGTFFQFRNKGSEPCRVLYIVSPAYLFELDENGTVIYDDSFIISESWKMLEESEWKPAGLPSLEILSTKRKESYLRLEKKSRFLGYERGNFGFLIGRTS